MSTYIILTTLAPGALRDPADFPETARAVTEKLKNECPQVQWKESYVVSGSYDILDIVEAPDMASVQRAGMIIRAYGHGMTETLVATPWADFLKMLGEKKSAAMVGTA